MCIFCQGKAKIVEKAQFTFVNEHFETVFNAEMAEKTHRVKCYLPHQVIGDLIIRIGIIFIYTLFIL